MCEKSCLGLGFYNRNLQYLIAILTYNSLEYVSVRQAAKYGIQVHYGKIRIQHF